MQAAVRHFRLRLFRSKFNASATYKIITGEHKWKFYSMQDYFRE